MKKLIKLLAIVLAATMLLPATALAAENDGGSRLVWTWLDWDDEGAYISDDSLSGRNYGAEEMVMTAGDDWYGVFFLIGEDGKRTPVIPEAGKGLAVEKMAKEEISSKAKQSQYYVRVSKADWKDAEITSGKASIKVRASLPDAAFYTAAGATQESYLRNDQQPCDPTRLSGKTAYFIVTATDEDSGRHITDVKKNTANGTPSLYDLEKVSDGVYKIVIKAEDGGVGVSLMVSWKEANGNAYEEERGYWFEYPRGPELWLRWLEWNRDVGLFVPEEAEAYPGMQPHPTDDSTNLIFYTCDYDDKGEQTLTPVLPKDLKGSAGVTITDVSDESTDAMAKYFVNVKVDEWMKNYTITAGEYTMRFDSNLPDFGIYSRPELTPEAYLDSWRFSPTQPNSTVYIGSFIPEGDDRVLADLKMDSKDFTLERYNDGFFKLTRNGINVSGGPVPFKVTWEWPGGNRETWDQEIWTDPVYSVVVSEKELPPDLIDTEVFYDSIKDQLTGSITMEAGETKTVYIGSTYFWPDAKKWRMGCDIPEVYIATGDLRLTPSKPGENVTKFTISCDVPGEYVITLRMNNQWFAYDKDGNEISDDLAAQGIYHDYDFETRTDKLIQFSEDGKMSDYDFDGTVEFKPGEEPDTYVFPIKVTVTGGSKPADPNAVSVTVGGKAVVWAGAEPFIDANSRTMVPLRAVAEAMGIEVSWDGSAREASFTDGEKTICFPIDSNAARTGSGDTVQMDTAAVIVNDRTYAPIRYLAQFFGHEVGWDAATRTVSIK